MIGFDTCAIIDLFKGDESLGEFIEKNKEPLAVNMINYLELSFGLDPTHHNYGPEKIFYDEFFQSLLNFNLSAESCAKASEIFRNLKNQGKTIDQFDCVIAAVFLSNGVNKILTRNTKHFNNIKNLRTITY